MGIRDNRSIEIFIEKLSELKLTEGRARLGDEGPAPEACPSKEVMELGTPFREAENAKFTKVVLTRPHARAGSGRIQWGFAQPAAGLGGLEERRRASATQKACKRKDSLVEVVATREP